ncbi:MAG: peptidase dimerization domain-containing protein, partial [Lachnospiraceae bacterium]|nr:peptidase dimerization domain-containing protein [Lachnospiraceae bacterium]
ISFDGYCPQCCSRAVGSHRYEITIRAQGGHSYANFGNTSAIKFAADVIQRLYAQEMPGGDKTTFNVGTIQGGTTVNTIPEKCVILYEFRSESQDNLMFMANQVEAIIAEFKEGGMDIEIKTLGIRPGNRAVPPTGIEEMTARNAEILSQFWEGPLDFNAYSTDANIPLSLGIPSNVIGTIRGGGAHTYDEWIDFSFQETGMKIAISLLKEYWK